MRVFLAGATGVIGSPLVPQLLKAGHEVTAMTRSALRAAQLEAIGAEPVVCDVFDADGVRAAMADASPEAVIHQVTALRGASNAKGKRELGWRSLGRPDRGRARGFPHGGCGGGP